MYSKLPTLSQSALQPWFNKPELVNASVAQLQKDLSPYGIVLHYSGNAYDAYRELYIQLQPQLENLLSSKTTVMEILYRVDVSEETLKMATLENESLSATLCRLILWRELQKVVTRFLLK